MPEEGTKEVTVYPTEEEYEDWKERAENYDSMTDFICMNVRKEASYSEALLDVMREEIRPDGQRRAILRFVEENPGVDFSDLASQFDEMELSRLSDCTDSLVDTRILVTRDDRYYSTRGRNDGIPHGRSGNEWLDETVTEYWDSLHELAVSDYTASAYFARLLLFGFHMYVDQS